MTNVWTAEPLEVVSDTGSGVAQTFDVFAGVNADPTILVGTYSDTVAVTVDF